MRGTDVLDRAFVTTTCRSRLLENSSTLVDEEGSLSSGDVMQVANDSACAAGHELHYAALSSDRPNLTSASGRITIHGRRATWTFRGRNLTVIAVDAKASRREATSEGSPPSAESADVAPPAVTARLVQEDPPDEAVVTADVGVESGAVGHESTLSEPATPAVAPAPASDLVSQIERLAALKNARC